MQQTSAKVAASVTRLPQMLPLDIGPFRQHQGPSEGCTDRAGHTFVKCVMSEERLRRAIRQVPWYDLQNPYRLHARSCTTLLGTRNSK